MPKKRRRHSIKPQARKKRCTNSKNAYNLHSFISPRHHQRKQRGGFLNRYDFAYAGRDTVNQAAKHIKTIAPDLLNQAMNRVDKLAPSLVRTASQELDAIAARRIDELVQKTGNLAPGLIKGAIEELYKTPFRLFGRFGQKNINNLSQEYLKG